MIITGILLTILLFSILFVITGLSISNNFIFNKNTNVGLQYTIAYFTGMALFASFWRIISYLINSASLSMYLTILICIIIIYVFGRKFIKTSIINVFVIVKNNYFSILGISAFIFLFTLFYWITPFNELNPFTIIGSLHSPRYANLATYILDFDRIPIVGQNYGQSMLTTIPMIVGLNKPLLTLNLWLSVTMVNFVFLTYTLFRYLNLKRKYALLGSIVVLFGNTAISFVQALVIDSGSPFICNGYTDSISSIGTFILFVLYLKKIYDNNTQYKISIKDFVILFILAIYWNISSPQNIIFAFAFLSILIFSDLIQGKFLKSVFLKISIVFFVFNLIGITQGGMFTPSNFKDKINLPGMMDIKDKSGIEISPGMPYHIGWAGTWEYGPTVTNSHEVVKETLKSVKSNPLKNIIKSIYLFESIVTDSLRIIFWPFLGIVGLYIINKKYLKKRYNTEEKEVLNKYNLLFYCSIITFCIGFMLTFVFKISGYKWELSRFLILGYFLGMVCLVVLFDYLNSNNLLSKKTVLILSMIIIIGPVLNSLLIILKNLFSLNNSLGFLERISILIDTLGVIK